MVKRKFSSTFWEGIVLFAVSILGIVMSFISHKDFNVEWKLSPYLFPLIISIFLFILSISILASSLKENEKRKEKEKGDIKSLLIFGLICVFYLLVLNFLGFVLSSILLLISLMILLGERRWWFIALVSIISTVVIYLLFAKYLSVMLPKGRVFWYLGL
ncbi:MAG: tripartite tricarboxylate transporter TctB family protein [Candidatus Ornithospirochaeta sp.]